ncbi:MAG: DUF1080 domain-containing protein [Pirellula sp.]
MFWNDVVLTMKMQRKNFLSVCLTSLAIAALANVGLAQTPATKDAVVRNENPNGLPVPSGDGWKNLFNGQNLDGWQQKNGWAVYRIDGNSIHGTTSKNSPNSFLCTTQDYADFELRFEVKVHNDLNSGVQIRSKSLAEKDNGRVHGPQVEIEASPGESGYVYGEATGRNWISPTQPPHSYLKNNDWNQYHVRAKGKRIQTWINGKLVEDITDSLSHDSGFIGLQVHGIGADQGPFDVRWRNIEIRELK